MNQKSLLFLLISLLLMSGCTRNGDAQTKKGEPQPASRRTLDGYRGIWFTLGQHSAYGDKYSGGLGTYTAKHIPLAIYSPEANKTFFVYGGTSDADQRYLLSMVSYYDHKTHEVPRPTIVHDKGKDGVTDPHDNPSISMDAEGYIWIFISGRAQSRPGYKYRSVKPYDVSDFELITTEEMTYPQPWYVSGEGFLHLFTKYTSGRELYWETSTDGRTWSTDQKLAGFGGHYQISKEHNGKVITAFNWHEERSVDRRTNLYYVQTKDMGKTWTTVEGKPLEVPLDSPDNEALVVDYAAKDRLVYLNDIAFDQDGHPIIQYVTSSGHQPGPDNGPRIWKVTHWDGQEWNTYDITESDHNYDMGSLYVDGDIWTVIGPTESGPQVYQTGGELAIWMSQNQGKTWKMTQQITRDSQYNHTYARAPVNANDSFYVFWADGDPTQLSPSRLYFSNSAGERYWQLPYVMEEEFARPVDMTTKHKEMGDKW